MIDPDTSEDVSDSMKKLYVQWLLSMKKSGKPFALWCTSSGSDEAEFIEQIEASRIPVFRSSERAVKALSAMNRYRLKNSRGIEL